MGEGGLSESCALAAEVESGSSPSLSATTRTWHDASPGVSSFITVAYAQNGAEIGVCDFPRQGCDL